MLVEFKLEINFKKKREINLSALLKKFFIIYRPRFLLQQYLNLYGF